MSGKFCLTSSLRIVVTWSAEIFPTVIRAEGIGFLQIASRFGAACSPYVSTSLEEHAKGGPFYVMGGLAVVGGLLVLFLPETKGMCLLEESCNHSGKEEVEVNCGKDVGSTPSFLR